MGIRPIHICAVLLLLCFCTARAVIFYVNVNSTNPTPPYADWNTAATNIQDGINLAHSDDVVLVTNGIYQTYTGNPSFYDSNTMYYVFSLITIPAGVTVASVNGPSATVIQAHGLSCACLLGNAALYGFTLTNGRAFINGSGSLGGGAYCVTTNALISNCIICSNQAVAGAGVYLGTLTNCLLSNNLATSYNSTSGKTYSGGGAYGSVMNNCVLAQNTADQGGGAFNCALNQCSVIQNSANNQGGGAYNCTLSQCAIVHNFANLPLSQLPGTGGGAWGGTISGCTIISNVAPGGCGAGISNVMVNCLISHNQSVGANPSVAVGCDLTNCTVCLNANTSQDGLTVMVGCTLRNCIIYSNQLPSQPDYSFNTFGSCCVEPSRFQNISGSNNFTGPPMFVNGTNDFHLQSNSPCINSGYNAFCVSTNDLDGNPRIVGDTVDVGTYEYQTPTSILSYAWAKQYGLPTDGSVDYLDLDGTGMVNWQKSIAGLNPTNPASMLAMLSPPATNNPNGVKVIWQSVNNRTYYVQRATDLTSQPAFSAIQSNLVGKAGATSFTDATATNSGPYYYRVGIQ